jgi:hypothetical protein
MQLLSLFKWSFLSAIEFFCGNYRALQLHNLSPAKTGLFRGLIKIWVPNMKHISYLIFSISIIGIALLGFLLITKPAKAEITAAIIVDPVEGLITDENGGSDSFTIQLDSQPTSNVTIDLTSNTPTEGVVSPEKILINKNKWEDLYDVEVSGVPDGIEDGDILYQIIGIVSSADPNFNELPMPTVSVTNLNDPVPIAKDDHPPIDGYKPIIVPVLENDLALNDIPIEITVVSDPVYGTYSINPDPENTITYTPSETFLGLDQLTYMVCDLDGDCASADVIIEDQIPPEIISVSPVSLGETYEVTDEDITIKVEVTDNFQVDCVNFIRWDAKIEQYIQLGEVCQPPYSIKLQGSTLNYRWNQVYFQASDMAGNLSPHAFIWLFRVSRNFIPLVISP